MSLNLADCRLIRTEALPILKRRQAAVILGVARVVTGPDRVESCRDYFRRLGFGEAICIDVVDWEGCDEIVDLNRPVMPRFEGAFDLVVDPGTLEHVFDARQALANCAAMCRVGGAVYHHSPLNWVNHGFFNFSPAFFVDAYRANGFDPVKVFRRRAKDRRATRWEYKPQVTQVLGGGRRYLMHVVAGKARDARGFRVPHQARYVEGHWRS